MTRLLKTPIIGRIAAVVDSSRSDMLAGLSKWEILRTPPAFCATAALAANNPIDNELAAASTRRPRFIPTSLPVQRGGREARARQGQEATTNKKTEYPAIWGGAAHARRFCAVQGKALV